MIQGKIIEILISYFSEDFGVDISRYGKLENTDLDRSNKILSTNLILNGENQPVRVKVHYSLAKVEGKSNLIIGKIKFSREWLNAISDKYYPKDSAKVPLPYGTSVLL